LLAGKTSLLLITNNNMKKYIDNKKVGFLIFEDFAA
jgi:hypothetical protein